MSTVSVIIPTYNRADVLPRAVESVLSQTYEDFELLVVDDGSTDGTAVRLDRFEDSRVRAITHETNRGANAARNTGIERADGEYVAFLDSDDEWRPTKIERQVKRVEADDGEWVGAYCDAERRLHGAIGALQLVVADALARFDDPGVREGGEELAGELLADNVHTAAGSTLLVRTDVAREVGGFDESLERFQDPEFVLRVLEYGDLAYVDESLVVRHDTGAPAPQRVHEASEQYRAKHAETIDRYEAGGYDVTGAHELVVAKHYLSDGSLGRGLSHLRSAAVDPRHLPGVLWAAISGIRQNRPVGRSVAVGLGVALLLVLTLRRR